MVNIITINVIPQQNRIKALQRINNVFSNATLASLDAHL